MTQTHEIAGQPLAACSVEALSKAACDLEAWSSIADTFTPEQDARLKALWAAYDAKPEPERRALEERYEREA